MTQAAVLDDRDDWLEDAVAAIHALALSGLTFSADDLHREMRTPPHSNLPGIAFSKARALKYITTVGYQQSSTKSRKNGVVRLWTGCIAHVDQTAAALATETEGES